MGAINFCWVEPYAHRPPSKLHSSGRIGRGVCPSPLGTQLGALTRRAARFGMAIQVFFESTTPLLHLLGALKTLGATNGRLYMSCGAQDLQLQSARTVTTKVGSRTQATCCGLCSSGAWATQGPRWQHTRYVQQVDNLAGCERARAEQVLVALSSHRYSGLSAIASDT